MIRHGLLVGVLLALAPAAALAADNAIIMTPGFGVAERSRDVGGGVQSPQVVIGDTTGTASMLLGTFGTPPGAVGALSTNSFITNAGQQPMANSLAVNIASDQTSGCNSHGFLHITTATDTVAVQGVTAQKVYLCAWTINGQGTATVYFENTASINNNCSSTLTQISGLVTAAAASSANVSLPFGVYLSNTTGNGLCIKSTGTGGVDVDYWYAQR